MSIKTGTVLVTMELDGKLYFGADRRISWHWGKAASSPTPKVAKRNGILMSGTGSASLIFEVIHRCKFPKYDKRGGDKYIYDKFLPAILKDLRINGFAEPNARRLVSKANEKDDSGLSGVILIGLKDGKKSVVYELDLNTSMITVDRVPTDYAHGCGGDFAQALITYFKFSQGNTTKKTYEKLGLTAEEMITDAIVVAAEHSPGCDNSVDIVSL